MIRAALLQTCASDDPESNLATLLPMIAEAAAQGADLVLTPEVTNCVSASRARQEAVLRRESEDPTLAAVRKAARKHGMTILLGSLALKSEPPETRFANRSLLVGPDGDLVARYDKMHMFDVAVSETETYRESAGYRPGTEAVLARAAGATLGLTICYDLRFAYLYRALAQAGAEILTVPSAFSTATGPMHWEPLLRARAIETGCFVLAPAQTGTHTAQEGKSRKTYGRSLAVSPWGEVLLDAGTETGVFCVDLDLTAVADARARVPSLSHDRDVSGPNAI